MASTQQLWTKYNSKGFAAKYAEYSERANKDVNGNEITTTYATKAELPDITGKADKVTGGTENHVVSLDSTGNIKDSGIPATTAAEGTSSLVVTNTTSNNATTTTYEWKGWTSKTVQVPYEYVVIGYRAYKTVTIGNRKWMAEDLDYMPDNGITLVTERFDANHVIDSSQSVACYMNFDQANARDKNLGLLYSLKATKYLIANQSTLFPSGWRIPVKADFQSIESALNIVYSSTAPELRTPNLSWCNNEWNYFNPSNSSGFTALPGGVINWNSNNGNNFFGGYTYHYYCAGNYTWNTNVPNDLSGMTLTGSSYHNINTEFGAGMALPIRLVKDV